MYRLLCDIFASQTLCFVFVLAHSKKNILLFVSISKGIEEKTLVVKSIAELVDTKFALNRKVPSAL